MTAAEALQKLYDAWDDISYLTCEEKTVFTRYCEQIHNHLLHDKPLPDSFPLREVSLNFGDMTNVVMQTVPDMDTDGKDSEIDCDCEW